MPFAASLDAFALWSSVGLTVGLLGIAFALSRRRRARGLIPLAILVGMLGFGVWQAPRGYTVESGSLVIHRYLSQRIVPLQAPTCARLEPEARDRHRRVRGSGGFLGYFGAFAEPTLGDVEWYATRRDTAVLVTTAGRHLVVSPDDPDAFIQAACGAAS